MHINWHWRAFTQQKTYDLCRFFAERRVNSTPHCAWWMDSALLYSCDVFQACLCVHECNAFKPMIWIASFKCSRKATCIHRLKVNTTLCKKSLQAVLLYGSPYATTARPHRIYIGVPTLQLPLQPKAQALTKNRCNRHCSCKYSTSSPVALWHSFFTFGISNSPRRNFLNKRCSSKSTFSDRFVAPFYPLQAGSHFPLGQGFPQTAENLCRELVPAEIQFSHLGSVNVKIVTEQDVRIVPLHGVHAHIFTCIFYNVYTYIHIYIFINIMYIYIYVCVFKNL